MRKLRAEVEAKAEYVGPKFAEEARKIHYEEAPARGIYGEATTTTSKGCTQKALRCSRCRPCPKTAIEHTARQFQ